MCNKRNKTNIKPYGSTVKPHNMTKREIQIIARLMSDSEHVTFGVLYNDPDNKELASIYFGDEVEGFYIPRRNEKPARYQGLPPKGYYIYACLDCYYDEINPDAWVSPDLILKSRYVGECILLYKLNIEE